MAATTGRKKSLTKHVPLRGGIVKHVLADSIDQTLVIGPLLVNPEIPGWYFMIASADKKGFRADMVRTETIDHAMAQQDLQAVLMELARPGVLIHLMDDELAMVRLCEALWPGERVSKLRRTVEAELRGR